MNHAPTHGEASAFGLPPARLGLWLFLAADAAVLAALMGCALYLRYFAGAAPSAAVLHDLGTATVAVHGLHLLAGIALLAWTRLRHVPAARSLVALYWIYVAVSAAVTAGVLYVVRS